MFFDVLRPDFDFLPFKPLRHNRIFGFFWGESLKFFQISYKKKNTNFPVEDQQQRVAVTPFPYMGIHGNTWEYIWEYMGIHVFPGPLGIHGNTLGIHLQK